MTARTTQEAELAILREITLSLASTVARLGRTVEAARIEMRQNGPDAAMQWILNVRTAPFGEGDPLAWDGKESARHWFDRVTAADARTKPARNDREQALSMLRLEGSEAAAAVIGRTDTGGKR